MKSEDLQKERLISKVVLFLQRRSKTGHRVPGQTHEHAGFRVPDSVPCSATALIPTEN